MIKYGTPLRYPGGKQKLAPFISEIIHANNLVGCEYAEPYAGGAGVAVNLLLNGTVSRVHLNDVSPPIYAFWKSILNKSDDFCRKIASVSLTVEEWRRQREILARHSEFSQFEVGFSLFYLNRCNRSGIPSGGLIGGLSQIGDWLMDARFPRAELIRRVETIAAKKKSILVKKQNAEVFVKEYLPTISRNALIYCDPPYFRKADRLYLNYYNPEDHKRVANVIQKHIRHHWIVSYDGAPEILRHYRERRHFLYDLQYNAHKAYKGKEVFFFSDKLILPETSAIDPIAAGIKLTASWKE